MQEPVGKAPPLQFALVEDNNEDADLMLHSLRRIRPQIQTKRFPDLTTFEVESDLRADPWDLVILDLGLPDTLGLATLRRARNFLTDQVPVLVLTSNEDPELARAAIREGAQDFLVKNTMSSDATMRLIANTLERFKLQRQVQELIEVDQLTRALTRPAFYRRVSPAIAAAKRRGRLGAILYVDIRHFKAINDTFGHTTGDGVLAEAARRLIAATRTEECVGRMGGDEFTILLTETESEEQVHAVCSRILKDLSVPLTVGSQHLDGISASIGYAMFPEQGEGPEDLVHRADSAMYSARAAGEQLMRYSPARDRFTLSNELGSALAKGELDVTYSPVTAVGDPTEVVGFDARVSWQHPRHGFVDAEELAELVGNTGLSDTMANWILDQVSGAHSGATPFVLCPIPMRSFDSGSFLHRLSNRPETDVIVMIPKIPATRGDEYIRRATRLSESGVRLGLDAATLSSELLEHLRVIRPELVRVSALSLPMTAQGAERRFAEAFFELVHEQATKVLVTGDGEPEQWAALSVLGVDFVSPGDYSIGAAEIHSA